MTISIDFKRFQKDFLDKTPKAHLGQGGEVQVLLEGCGGLPGLHIQERRGEVHLTRAFHTEIE